MYVSAEGVLGYSRTEEDSFKPTVHDHLQKAEEARLPVGPTDSYTCCLPRPPPQPHQGQEGWLVSMMSAQALDGRHDEDTTAGKVLHFTDE